MFTSEHNRTVRLYETAFQCTSYCYYLFLIIYDMLCLSFLHLKGFFLTSVSRAVIVAIFQLNSSRLQGFQVLPAPDILT